MTDDFLFQRIKEEAEKLVAERTRKKMSKMGKSRSAKKRRASRKSLLKARRAMKHLLKRDPDYLRKKRNSHGRARD